MIKSSIRIDKTFKNAILLLLITFSCNLFSQNIHFRHLTIDDGLSQNAVSTMLQDKEGFMWFGTKDGLNRYDGYSFTIYHHDPFDSNTISASYITKLFEDSRGVIWIGMLNGNIDCYYKKNDSFKHIKYLSGEPTLSSNNKINTITEDSFGNIWIGTNGNGLFMIPGRKNKSSKSNSLHFVYNPKDESCLSSNYISSLFADRFGTLWIGTNKKLEKYNYKGKNFIHFDIISKSPLAPGYPSDNDISSIYESKNGEFWIGTPSGLVLFDRNLGSYKLFPHHYNVFRFGWGVITGILENNSGSLWLSTPGELMEFNTITKVYKYYRNDPFNPASISYNSVSSMCRDRTGIFWFGTPGEGINIYDPKMNRFSLFVRKNDETSRITGFSVRSILEDNNENIWISTDVLYKWNRKTGEIKSYETSSERPDDFGNTGAWSIIQAASGNIWFATSQGLFNYDPSVSKAKLIKFEPSDTSGLPQKEVFCVYQDRKNNLWIVTENYLCELTDLKKGKFRKFRYNKKESVNETIYPCLYEDNNNNLWLGSNNGLIRFNVKSKSFNYYKTNTADSSSLNNNYIKSICPDPIHPDKYLWLGTSGGGLNKFNIKNETFSHYTTRNGLPNNVVYGILPDKKGNLWLSTNRGISKFNPSDLSFKNYDVVDGLQSNEFNTGAYYLSKKGEMFFGGIKGLNYFYPQNIKNNSFIPQIAITNCKILNQSSGEKGNNIEYSIRTLNVNDTLSLPFQENIIQFDFASLDYSAPDKNKYSYKLEGFNKDWFHLGKTHTVTFTNLSPGEYTLHVKGTNNDGVWNEKGASLKLIILPPWWQAWWAYSIYILMFFSALYYLRRYELNRLQLKNQLKLEKVESDTLRRLDQLKSHFFANISHEFRTPLTLILGQVDSVMSSKIEVKEKGKLQIVNRNAKRLLNLINQLLDLSKLEAGGMELHSGKHNIVSFLKSLFYSFESIAETQKITLKFESKFEKIPVLFDPDKMEKIFYNLVSNAFKFTEPGGEIKVNLNIINSNKVEIRIKDTGIGIPADRLPHIFDRFYQADSSGTREHEGTGIGLALTKELIELHKGKISVTSKLRDGTEFIISLPYVDLKKEKEDLIHFFTDSYSFEKIEQDIKKNKIELVPESLLHHLDKKEIILIVEDNPDVRSYICEQLENDYCLIQAENGERGINKALEKIPDLIITDVMMPKMDGYKFSQTIRADEKTSHIPIIMLTAKAGLDDKIQGLETGIDAYLTKPFSAKELKVRVKSLISQRIELRKRFSKSTIIKPSEVTTTHVDLKFIEKVIKVIELHFEDEQFGVEKLAGEVNMSISQLNRKLNALIDQPAGQLIRSLRLQRAADLLKQGAGSVAEICYKVGFNDQAYFSRAFKKQFGVSPSGFKEA